MNEHAWRVLDRPLVVRFILLAGFLFAASGCENSDSSKAREEQHPNTAVTEHGDTGSDTSSRSPTAPGPPIIGERLDNSPPENVLAYPEAVRVESLQIASKGNAVKAPPGVVMFVSSEPDPMKVANWYEKELTSAGWKLAETSGDGEYCLFEKAGQGMSVSVGTIPDPKPDGHADAQLLIVIDAN